MYGEGLLCTVRQGQCADLNISSDFISQAHHNDQETHGDISYPR